MNMEQPPRKDNSSKEQLPQKKNGFAGKAKAVLLGTLALGLSHEMQASSNPEDSTKNKQPAAAASFNGAKALEAKTGKSSEKIEMQFANYFTTDKAEISQENSNKIAALLIEYIGNINKDNIDQFLASNLRLRASSDPRPTNSYPGGNSELTKRRAEEAHKVIKGILGKIDFSKSGLTVEDIHKIIEKFKNIESDIPEGGVIDYHEVASEAEWQEAQSNETKKLEIYQKMRFVNLVVSSLPIEKETPKISLETGGGFNTDKFSEGYMLIDGSPSTAKHLKKFRKFTLKATKLDIPMKVIEFTDTADHVYEAKDLREAAEIINNLPIITKVTELALDVGIKELEKKEDQKPAFAFFGTDELLQNISKEKLDKLENIGNRKNIQFLFLVMLDEKELVLNLDGVRAAFNQKYEKMEREKDIELTKIGIGNFEKEINWCNKEISKGEKNTKEIKELKSRIKAAEDNIVIFKKRLKNFESIDVDNLADFAIRETPDVKYFDTQPDYSQTPNTYHMDGSGIAKNQ